MQLLLEIYKFCQIQEVLLYKLFKSLYDLKNLRKLWNQNVIAVYKKIGFR